MKIKINFVLPLALSGLIFLGELFFRDWLKNFSWLNTLLLQAAGLLLTYFLFRILIRLFGSISFIKGFLNFLIGEEGTYSLSRLQAVIWALVIMGCQISIALSLCFNSHDNLFFYYEPVLSESATWLLGLSFSSYILVKGITVNRIAAKPRKFIRNQKKASLRDLLVGDNGLDFSRCQMFIWTLIALVVFLSKCYFFIQYTAKGTEAEVVCIFRHTYELNEEGKVNASRLPYVPYLPWSFIILMGLSQGAYVGKKLVPTFKLDDLKADKKTELDGRLAELNAKRRLLQMMTDLPPGKVLSPLDEENKQQILKGVSLLQEEINDITGEMNQIDNALQLR